MSEIISQTRFDSRFAAGELVLTFIGMSNMGKSWWTKRFAAAGFGRICCDDEIERELDPQIRAAGFTDDNSIQRVAAWMGLPHESQSRDRQRAYLAAERTLGLQIAGCLRSGPRQRNMVIDTTGSVVHTGADVCEGLASMSTVVYMEATPDRMDKMYHDYLAEPKPVCWGDRYRPKPDEESTATLARCYPELLAHRSVLYADMAHVTVPYDTRRAMGGVDDFMSYLRDQLPA